MLGSFTAICVVELRALRGPSLVPSASALALDLSSTLAFLALSCCTELWDEMLSLLEDSCCLHVIVTAGKWSMK